MSAIASPPLLHAFDNCDWSYYVAGHDEEALLQIDEPDELEWEPVWMLPSRGSSLDDSEFSDDRETMTRDERGRFAPVIYWIECRQGASGAEPFLGVKYAPRD